MKKDKKFIMDYTNIMFFISLVLLAAAWGKDTIFENIALCILAILYSGRIAKLLMINHHKKYLVSYEILKKEKPSNFTEQVFRLREKHEERQRELYTTRYILLLPATFLMYFSFQIEHLETLAVVLSTLIVSFIILDESYQRGFIMSLEKHKEIKG